MKKETYERLSMDVTEFDVEDIITTSGTESEETVPSFGPSSPWELPADN